jgi:hypothetical protein
MCARLYSASLLIQREPACTVCGRLYSVSRLYNVRPIIQCEPAYTVRARLYNVRPLIQCQLAYTVWYVAAYVLEPLMRQAVYGIGPAYVRTGRG